MRPPSMWGDPTTAPKKRKHAHPAQPKIKSGKRGRPKGSGGKHKRPGGSTGRDAREDERVIDDSLAGDDDRDEMELDEEENRLGSHRAEGLDGDGFQDGSHETDGLGHSATIESTLAEHGVAGYLSEDQLHAAIAQLQKQA